MSRFISLDGFIDESKVVIGINKIEFYWGKLPHVPQTQLGRSQILRLMNSLQKKEQVKVKQLRQQLIQNQYKKLKKSMKRFAKKPQTNFFGSTPQGSISLQTTPRINLQQKYGNKIYPKLMSIKQAEDVLKQKMRNKSIKQNHSVENVKKIHNTLSLITKQKKYQKQNRQSLNNKKIERYSVSLLNSYSLNWKQEQPVEKQSLKTKQFKTNYSEIKANNTKQLRKYVKNKFYYD